MIPLTEAVTVTFTELCGGMVSFFVVLTISIFDATFLVFA